MVTTCNGAQRPPHGFILTVLCWPSAALGVGPPWERARHFTSPEWQCIKIQDDSCRFHLPSSSACFTMVTLWGLLVAPIYYFSTIKMGPKVPRMDHLDRPLIAIRSCSRGPLISMVSSLWFHCSLVSLNMMGPLYLGAPTSLPIFL